MDKLLSGVIPGATLVPARCVGGLTDAPCRSRDSPSEEVILRAQNLAALTGFALALHGRGVCTRNLTPDRRSKVREQTNHGMSRTKARRR
jgi:hypothetical protein